MSVCTKLCELNANISQCLTQLSTGLYVFLAAFCAHPVWFLLTFLIFVISGRTIGSFLPESPDTAMRDRFVENGGLWYIDWSSTRWHFSAEMYDLLSYFCNCAEVYDFVFSYFCDFHWTYCFALGTTRWWNMRYVRIASTFNGVSVLCFYAISFRDSPFFM